MNAQIYSTNVKILCQISKESHDFNSKHCSPHTWQQQSPILMNRHSLITLLTCNVSLRSSLPLQHATTWLPKATSQNTSNLVFPCCILSRTRHVQTLQLVLAVSFTHAVPLAKTGPDHEEQPGTERGIPTFNSVQIFFFFVKKEYRTNTYFMFLVYP